MRVWRSLLGALVLGALATPAAPTLAADDYHLTTGAARGISEELAGKTLDKSRRLESVTLDLCYRLGPLRIDCDFLATGETTNANIACDFTVSVRARDRQPVGQIGEKRCTVTLKPLLTYSAAYGSMVAVASEAIGLPVGEAPAPGHVQLGIARTSRSSFLGHAIWEPMKTGGQSDLCVLELTAKAGDRVGVEIGKRVCLIGAG